MNHLLSNQPTTSAFEAFANFLEEQWEEGLELSSQDISNLVEQLEGWPSEVPRWAPHHWVHEGSEFLLLCTHAIIDIQVTSNQDLQRILSTGHFENILELECALYEPMTKESARVMGAPSALPSLRILSIGFCLTNEVLGPLFGSEGFSSLQHLALDDNELTDDAVGLLSSFPLAKQVKSLTLRNNRITSFPLDERWVALESLDLRENPLTKPQHDNLAALASREPNLKIILDPLAP